MRPRQIKVGGGRGDVVGDCDVHGDEGAGDGDWRVRYGILV